MVVGLAAMSTTRSADWDATNCVASAGTNSAVKRWVPRSRSPTWSEAEPADSVTVPTTVAPSRSCTVPAGVPEVATTVATRVAARPVAVAVSVVVVAFATTGSVTSAVRAGEVEPS